MAQGTRGLVASACLLPNLVMTAAEWAGDQVQGSGARRECFDARDPIPQRESKPLRKPPSATWGKGAICSAASGAADIGKGRSSHWATSPVCWIEESNKTLGGRTGQAEASWRGACCRLQGARCNTTCALGLVRAACRTSTHQEAGSSQSTGRARGGARGGGGQGCPGWGQLSSR